MYHDSICIDRPFVPDSFVNFFCRKDSSWIADEKEKDLKFNGSHFYVFAVCNDFHCLLIYFQSAHLVDLWIFLLSGI